MLETALLASALLFGGMTLYSLGFAAFVFNALPGDTAGKLIRQAFPHFYLFVLGGAALAAAITWPVDRASALILAVIAATTIFARQTLMPAINAASDDGAKTRFKTLHTISVVITLGHIVGSASVLLRLGAA